LGVVILARRGSETISRPVAVGASSADYQAQLQAQVALEQTRAQTQAQLLGGYMQALVAREQTAAQLEAQRLQAQTQLAAIQAQASVQQAQVAAQLQAAQMQAAVQQQQSLLGFLGGLASLFFLFSEETTLQAQHRRELAGARMALAYPQVS
jgi:hypothetical protein